MAKDSEYRLGITLRLERFERFCRKRVGDDWYRSINATRFHMDDKEHCVFAQVAGVRSYYDACDHFHMFRGDRKLQHMGVLPYNLGHSERAQQLRAREVRRLTEVFRARIETLQTAHRRAA